MNLIDHGMTVQEAIDAPRVSVTRAFGGGRIIPRVRFAARPIS